MQNRIRINVLLPFPHCSDPYSLPSNVRERNVPREDGGAGHLHPSREGQQEMEEDDEGWAGHQEEVDYTKEVVFEDSSDEDSPKKANKEHGKVNGSGLREISCCFTKISFRRRRDLTRKMILLHFPLYCQLMV